VLIETLPPRLKWTKYSTQLRDNIVGLNCGRWDYIFSYIKRLGHSPDRADPRPVGR
jgi:malate synthase